MGLFMGRVAIIGAGKGGCAILEAFVGDKDIEIIGISDTNPHAPGIKLAKELNIPVSSDFKSLLSLKPDIVINVTGSSELGKKIAAERHPSTEVVDGVSAKLFYNLMEKRRRSQEEAEELLNETKELYRIGLLLTSAAKCEDVLDILLLEALKVIKAPAGSIALYNDEKEELNMRASHGFSKEFSDVTTWMRMESGLTDYIIREKKPVVIDDISTHPTFDNPILIKEGVKSLAAVPLTANHRIRGILYIDDFKPRLFTEREVGFLSLLGTQATYAVEKFSLLEKVAETNEYLNNILNDSLDAIVTTNTEGRIVEFNYGAELMFGFKKKDIIGKWANTLWRYPEERSNLLNKLNKEGYIFNYETKFISKDGKEIDALITLSHLKNTSNQIVGTVGVSKDITGRKKLEKELHDKNIELLEFNQKLEERVIARTRDLENANRELEKASKLKSQFIANMSHELRTPLNSILGFSELLLTKSFGGLTEKQEKFTHIILNSGKHLLQLINNILDLTKIEAGKMDVHPEKFSVRDIIAEVEGIIRTLADKKKQGLKFNIENDMGNIFADKVKFKQILYNLISNAVKFTPDGGKISVDCGIIVEDMYPAGNLKGKSLKISVSDTGIGIKEEDYERIFSEFEQVDGSTTRQFDGTGLGLALTKRFVELQGGRIWVESEHGKGSTFIFTLPLSVEQYEVTAKPLIPTATLTPSYEDIAKVARVNAPLILIVEDDIPTSEVLSIYLVQAGYRIAHAYNGQEALKRTRELKPFCILLDVMLPEKDGWEVLNELKSDPETKDIPVIISSILENKELGFSLGALDYLVKPVDRNILLDKLGHLSFITKKEKRHINILCIDDNQESLDILVSTLEPEGFIVHTAGGGKEGIDKAFAVNPDLIILDLMMPEIDGFEVIRVLKENPRTKESPIIILTAKDLTVNDRLMLADKVDGLIQKSCFSKEELLIQIRDMELVYPHKAGLLDSVTGLFNNCYFNIRLATEIQRTERYKSPFVLMMFDFDNFRDYINTNGIQHANSVIRKVAEFMRQGLRGSDVIMRYGMDEIAIILPNITVKSAKNIAGRFRRLIEDYPFPGEEKMPLGKVTATAGIVSFPQDASKPEELVSNVHQLLRKGKEKGGNRVMTYEKA